MPRRLVASSSSAIAAIYLAGHLTTQTADGKMATSEARLRSRSSTR
jgi:hypothetical protein